MNAIIFIGGSKDCAPFVLAAKNLNYQTIIFDLDKNCFCRKISDYFYQISTHNLDDIISRSKIISNRYIISGVMTYSSSTEAMVAVSTVSAMFGLKSISLNSIKVTEDKNLTKKILQENGISSPKGKMVRTINDVKRFIDFSNCSEFIIKPASGANGSIGISHISKKSNIEKSFKNAKANSSDSLAIIEEFHEGEEYSVDGFITDNDPNILSVCKKSTLGHNSNFIMSGFDLLSKENLHEDEEKINKICCKTLDALDIRNSFFSIDLIKSKNKFYIIECGLLLDCKIDKLLYFCKLDIYDLFIRLITSNLNFSKHEFINQASLKFFFAQREGLLRINNTNPKISGKEIEFLKEDNAIVRRPQSISDAICFIISESPSIGIESNDIFSVVD